MARFINKAGQIIEIEMKEWNGSGYGPDWSFDFYDVGALGFNEDLEAFEVDDFDYLVGQARLWEEENFDLHGVWVYGIFEGGKK